MTTMKMPNQTFPIYPDRSSKQEISRLDRKVVDEDYDQFANANSGETYLSTVTKLREEFQPRISILNITLEQEFDLIISQTKQRACEEKTASIAPTTDSAASQVPTHTTTAVSTNQPTTSNAAAAAAMQSQDTQPIISKKQMNAPRVLDSDEMYVMCRKIWPSDSNVIKEVLSTREKRDLLHTLNEAADVLACSYEEAFNAEVSSCASYQSLSDVNKKNFLFTVIAHSLDMWNSCMAEPSFSEYLFDEYLPIYTYLSS
jgi:hypothetical protein